jgi:CRISPR-associated protein Cas2
MKSKFRVGWIMVMFDLPVVEETERKKASKFRNDLLDLGFYMLQESVYLRSCVTQEKQKQFLNKVRNCAPTRGSITAFFLTNKQWENSVHLSLYEKNSTRSIHSQKEETQQMSFW